MNKFVCLYLSWWGDHSSNRICFSPKIQPQQPRRFQEHLRRSPAQNSTHCVSILRGLSSSMLAWHLHAETSPGRSSHMHSPEHKDRNGVHPAPTHTQSFYSRRWCCLHCTWFLSWPTHAPLKEKLGPSAKPLHFRNLSKDNVWSGTGLGERWESSLNDVTFLLTWFFCSKIRIRVR